MSPHGYAFDAQWLDAFWEFRFPVLGKRQINNISLELRAGIEPWHVLGEEAAAGGMARYVDSSLERLQLKVSGYTDTRYQITCNGYVLPLVFDVIDTWSNRSLGGCSYHVSDPGGRSYEDVPVNANVAEARRIARFDEHRNTPAPASIKAPVIAGGSQFNTTPARDNVITVGTIKPNPEYPNTADLRWRASSGSD